MKVITWLLAIFAIAVGAWFIWQKISVPPAPQVVAPAPVAEVPAPVAPTPTVTAGGLTISDNSDASLDSGLTEVDARMNAAADASAALDSNMTDAPVAQTE